MWGLVIYTMISMVTWSEIRMRPEESTATTYVIEKVYRTYEECKRDEDKFNLQNNYDYKGGKTNVTKRQVAACQQVERQ